MDFIINETVQSNNVVLVNECKQLQHDVEDVSRGGFRGVSGVSGNPLSRDKQNMPE